MIKSKEVITGKVQKDVFGGWDDCSPGLYIDSDKISTIFDKYLGKNIVVIIEEVESVKE